MIYDEKLREARAPQYEEYEIDYRNDVLGRLSQAYTLRETPHMELNDLPYSEYFLRNRQMDLAWNPPKKQRSDSRLVSGLVREKDNTLKQLIMDMNLQPYFTPKIGKEHDPDHIDIANLMTAMVRNSFDDERLEWKMVDIVGTNVAQGDSFILEEIIPKSKEVKELIGYASNPKDQKFNIKKKKDFSKPEVRLIQNTSVYVPNLLENDLKKQPYMFIVMHIGRGEAKRMFGDFDRWNSVPKKTYSMTVPANTDGVYGDYWLNNPAKDYVEWIIYFNQEKDEMNHFINGVMMYPVTMKDGKCVGFPLSYVSPSGVIPVTKGSNEKIPFFFYGKSLPSKNEVKEEALNNTLRILNHKMEYSAFPSLGNKSDKVFPANIWDPAVVIPDLSESDISVLNPNGVLTQADFNYANFLSGLIDDSSVSKSVEGTDPREPTATQFVTQMKQNLQKIGVSVDGVENMIKDMAWLRLQSCIALLDENIDGKYKEFSLEHGFEGMGVNYMLQESSPEEDLVQMFEREFKNSDKPRNVYISPKKVKKYLKDVKDNFVIKVISEPDGNEQSLLGVLFNTLQGYANILGEPIINLNTEYLDQVIAKNSGLDANKLFVSRAEVQQGLMEDSGMGVPIPELGGQSPLPRAPQNNILANTSL